MAREYPDVRANTVASFALNDYEWMLAFEADELHRIVDLMRHLRGARPGGHTRVEIPFYTGRRKPVERAASPPSARSVLFGREQISAELSWETLAPAAARLGADRLPAAPSSTTSAASTCLPVRRADRRAIWPAASGWCTSTASGWRRRRQGRDRARRLGREGARRRQR